MAAVRRQRRHPLLQRQPSRLRLPRHDDQPSTAEVLKREGSLGADRLLTPLVVPQAMMPNGRASTLGLALTAHATRRVLAAPRSLFRKIRNDEAASLSIGIGPLRRHAGETLKLSIMPLSMCSAM